jgi:hypothetical protein
MNSHGAIRVQRAHVVPRKLLDRDGRAMIEGVRAEISARGTRQARTVLLADDFVENIS